jgi:phosphate starvation-inducible PhoH-like protein
MAKTSRNTRAKRANRPNPREERNLYNVQENVIELNFPRRQKSRAVKIIPRGVVQEDYIEALEDPNIHIVFGIGPAGTGKSYIAVQYAIKALNEGKYNKIVVCRPNVAVDDKDIGFLPGTVYDKLFPVMLPIFDIFSEYYTQKEIEHMISDKIVELVPLAHIRGRTFKHSIIILDESQGTTQNSMKAMLTRIGEGSKIVMTGDLRQSDRASNNGLEDIIEKIDFYKPNGIKIIKFTNKDIERHPIIGEILKLYDET